MISLRNVERSFPVGGRRSYVLRRITLDIAARDFETVMGPSGKSTLLFLIGMLDVAWTGECFLNDEAVHKLDRKKPMALHKEQIGLVFQQYHLLDDLTVAENLDVPLSYRDIRKSERQAMVGDTLDRFGMVAKKDLYPSQLSGGHQQLVGIARAIIHKPKLLLADEPTGNLHSAQGREIPELFRKLNSEGTTIIQVTQSEFNATYGKRMINLRDGWIE